GGVENLKNRICYLQKTSTGGANFQKVSTGRWKFKKLGVCVTNNVLKSHILWDAQGSWGGDRPVRLPLRGSAPRLATITIYIPKGNFSLDLNIFDHFVHSMLLRYAIHHR